MLKIVDLKRVDMYKNVTVGNGKLLLCIVKHCKTKIMKTETFAWEKLKRVRKPLSSLF
jgi:hypothetical protein